MAAPLTLNTVPLADPLNNFAVNLGGVAVSGVAAVSVATNTGLVAVYGLRTARLTAASVVTATMVAGSAAGQEVTLVNESAVTISLVTGTTLNAAYALLATTCARFVWDDQLAIWIHSV